MQGHLHLIRLPRAPSNLDLNVSRDVVSCRGGENWRTGSSDLDFKISVSCPILIPGTTVLHILMSKCNLMQTWNNDCCNTNSSQFSEGSSFVWLKKWDPQKGSITIQSRLYLKRVLCKRFPWWIYLPISTLLGLAIISISWMFIISTWMYIWYDTVKKFCLHGSFWEVLQWMKSRVFGQSPRSSRNFYRPFRLVNNSNLV